MVHTYFPQIEGTEVTHPTEIGHAVQVALKRGAGVYYRDEKSILIMVTFTFCCLSFSA